MNGSVREPTYEFSKPNGENLLRELILYIAQQCEGDVYFGATKLNKILWLSDSASYAFYGEPITGVEYMKLEHGPAPRRLLPIKQMMLACGEIIERPRQIGRFTQQQVIALREPDLKQFSGRDIATVDAMIKAVWGKTADEVSEMSHVRGWSLAGHKEAIPYEAIFISDEGVTARDEIRAKELIEEHGWDV